MMMVNIIPIDIEENENLIEGRLTELLLLFAKNHRQKMQNNCVVINRI